MAKSLVLGKSVRLPSTLAIWVQIPLKGTSILLTDYIHGGNVRQTIAGFYK